MAQPPKKDAPTEPFKRVLGLCVRAIAQNKEMQVGFGPGKPELDGNQMHLPEPSRARPSSAIAFRSFISTPATESFRNLRPAISAIAGP